MMMADERLIDWDAGCDDLVDGRSDVNLSLPYPSAGI